jgi:hypothetical protein
MMQRSGWDFAVHAFICNEVADQKQNESQHHQQERRIASFAGNHDFSVNPCGRLSHYLHVAQSDGFPSSA